MPKSGITGNDQAAFLLHSFSTLYPASAGITPIILLIVWHASIIPLHENYYEVVLKSRVAMTMALQHKSDEKELPQGKFSSPVLLTGSIGPHQKTQLKLTQRLRCNEKLCRKIFYTRKGLTFYLFSCLSCLSSLSFPSYPYPYPWPFFPPFLRV